MSRKIFTKEQQQLLQQNPYIYSVTDTRITLTKAFKEIFMTAYNTGTSPRTILEDHGFDISIIGERHIWNISQRIHSHGVPKVWRISRRLFYSQNLSESIGHNR